MILSIIRSVFPGTPGFALAYNLGNFVRRLALPRKISHWSLITLREKLVKIGAKVVKHSRSVIFQMAEVAVPRALFKAIFERIGRLWLTPPWVKIAWRHKTRELAYGKNKEAGRSTYLSVKNSP